MEAGRGAMGCGQRTRRPPDAGRAGSICPGAPGRLAGCSLPGSTSSLQSLRMNFCCSQSGAWDPSTGEAEAGGP